MIQFNLLPDVKQQYIKVEHTKRLMISISFIASAAAIFILLVLLVSVYGFQKKNIHDINNDIHSNDTALENTPSISDILTVQSQLNSLPSLNAQKPAANRLFGYLSQLTPQQATISDLKVDYTDDTLAINGNAPSLDVVNTFIDGLKFTTYSVQGVTGNKPAFSSVVLASFSRDADAATYSITMDFDPVIFNNADTVKLTVGGQTQTSDQPSIIFKQSE